jgi:divalent metal cation (Fe/Co/Zn/Cd) transporter
MPDQTRGTVVLALAANVGVAVIKLAAGLLTGSASAAGDRTR